MVGHPATRYIIRRIADRIADPTRFRDSHSHVGSGRDAFYARFTQEEGENQPRDRANSIEQKNNVKRVLRSDLASADDGIDDRVRRVRRRRPRERA